MSRARFRWLVEFVAGGQTHRYAVEDVDVETAAGDVLEFRAGLDPLALGQGDVEVDVSITDPSVDWPVVGPLIDGSRVVLYRWQEDTLLEQAEVYSRGTATESEWGATYEQVEFTILPTETLPPMPDISAKVSVTTTLEDEGATSIPPGQSGMYYPVIFGFPGYLIREYVGPTSGLLFTQEPVVPCPMRVLFANAVAAADSEIVISHDASAFLPATAYIREEETGLENPLDVKVSVDAMGRQIGVATLTDFRLFALPDDGPCYTASFGPDSGGIAAPRTAYDVIVYVLTKWGGDTVDWARIPEVKDHLSSYMVDTFINSEVEGGVWSWLVMALGVADVGSTRAAGLPVAIRTSAQGRYLVPLRYTVDPGRATRTIDASRGEASRASSVKTVGRPLNLIELRYGYDLSIWAGEIVGLPALILASVIAGLTGVKLVTVEPSAVATQSVARYGPRVEPLDVPWTWDAATAVRVGHQILDRDALPWRVVKYLVPEEWRVREADTVRVIDDEVGLDEYGIVDGPPFVDASGMTVTIRFPGRT